MDSFSSGALWQAPLRVMSHANATYLFRRINPPAIVCALLRGLRWWDAYGQSDPEDKSSGYLLGPLGANVNEDVYDPGASRIDQHLYRLTLI